MSRATIITELYTLLDERRATASRPGDAPVPRERWLPAESAKSAEGGVASSALYDTSGRAPLAAQPGAAGAAREEPAGGAGQGHLGSAFAGPVWAWVDPAAPGRYVSMSAGAAVPPFSRPPSPQLAPEPQPWTPRGAPTRVAVLPASAPTELRMPVDVLRAMAAAATATGRTETEVWAAAAREWLYHHAGGNDPQPPDPAASAWPPAAPRSARDQSWTAIDILLGDLRTAASVRRLPPEPIQVDRAA